MVLQQALCATGDESGFSSGFAGGSTAPGAGDAGEGGGSAAARGGGGPAGPRSMSVRRVRLATAEQEAAARQRFQAQEAMRQQQVADSNGGGAPAEEQPREPRWSVYGLEFLSSAQEVAGGQARNMVRAKVPARYFSEFAPPGGLAGGGVPAESPLDTAVGHRYPMTSVSQVLPRIFEKSSALRMRLFHNGIALFQCVCAVKETQGVQIAHGQIACEVILCPVRVQS